jgi:hypothetical protein
VAALASGEPEGVAYTLGAPLLPLLRPGAPRAAA